MYFSAQQQQAKAAKGGIRMRDDAFKDRLAP
jgi:hypothetical protein